MKVLVGVDGSSHSLATVAFVGRLLSVERDELVLAYASPPLPFAGDDQLDPGVVARAQAALSGAVFDEAATRLPDAWQSRAERAELVGSPSTALLAAAQQRGVDLVAVGFRGAGLFERFMLGSVSRAVVESAAGPVLIVKHEPAGSDVGSPAGPREEQPVETANEELRALAAYDGPDMGARIAALTTQFSWPAKSRGWVITVVRPMFIHELPSWIQPITRDADVSAMADAWRKEHDEQVALAGDELQQFQQTLPECFRGTEPIVAAGRAGERILAAISEQQINLAIVGSRGRAAVTRLLLGSTSDQIITYAPCSVLVVR